MRESTLADKHTLGRSFAAGFLLATLLLACLLVAPGCESSQQAQRYAGMTDQERDYAKERLESLSHEMTRRDVVSKMGIPRHEYVRESGAMLEWYGPDNAPTSRIAIYFDVHSHPVLVRWMARNRFVWQHELKEKADDEQAQGDTADPASPQRP